MKLNIEFPVMVRGVPEKTADERWVIFSEQVEVDIPEASPRDLTPVVRIHDRKQRPDGSLTYHEASNYVRFGSDLYWEAEAFDSYKYTRFLWEGLTHRNELTAKVANAISRDVRSILAGWREKKRPIYPGPVASFIDNEVHFRHDSGHSLRLQSRTSLKLESCDEAELFRQTEAFKKHLEDFMICDGYLYIKSIEPLLGISRTPVTKDGAFIVTPVETFSMDVKACYQNATKKELFAYFPINRGEEAAEFARQLGSLQGKNDCEVFNLYDLDLYDEGLGSDLADRLSLHALAHALAGDLYKAFTCGAESVGDIGQALVDADLKDVAAWQALSKALTLKEADEIARSVVAGLSSPSGSLLPRRGEYELALDRWEEREVNVPGALLSRTSGAERVM